MFHNSLAARRAARRNPRRRCARATRVRAGAGAAPRGRPLSARFAVLRVRVGDGPVWGDDRLLPGAEVWLVGGWRSSGERKYDLSNLPPGTSRRALAGTIKVRRVCERAHQQRKEALGLDRCEGRSWAGLHRRALTTCIACADLQNLRRPAAPAPRRASSDGAGE